MTMSEMWVDELSPLMLKKARTQLGESPESRAEGLRKIQKLIEAEADLRPVTDESFLVRFLRAKKFDAARAFRVLRNYYAYKAKHSGRITDVTPAGCGWILDMDRIFVSPIRDAEGAAIIIFHCGSVDLDEVEPDQFLAAILCCAELALSCAPSQVVGFRGLWDFSGMTLTRILRWFRPRFIYTAFCAIMDTFPVRVKGLHVVFEPSYFDFTYNTICKPVLSNKLRERMHFHGENLQSLLEFFPRESLPEVLGGTMVEKDYSAFKAEMHKRQPLAEALTKYSIYGKKYPAKLRSCWVADGQR